MQLHEVRERDQWGPDSESGGLRLTACTQAAVAGLYWDATSGGFYDSSKGKWYSYDASTQQFTEWAQ